MTLRATAAAFIAVAYLAGACASERPVAPAPVAEQARPVGLCPAVQYAGRTGQILPVGGRHDAALVDLVVLDQVNAVRCAQALAPLVPDPALRRAATIHARDMAGRDFFDHISPVAGRRTPSDRLQSAGARFRIAAENIIEGRYMSYRSGTGYRIEDAAACRFSYADGTPLTRQSYATLAREVVERWMQSPGHRQNLLDPRLGRHGFALMANRSQALCGGLYAAQVFTD